jgi:hypothetical protein
MFMLPVSWFGQSETDQEARVSGVNEVGTLLGMVRLNRNFTRRARLATVKSPVQQDQLSRFKIVACR